jgi:hypothetical protein
MKTSGIQPFISPILPGVDSCNEGKCTGKQLNGKKTFFQRFFHGVKIWRFD